MGYVYANLPRHGLGNILFPWARAAIYARSHDLTLIPPRWAQFRVGPYLRGDIDKRQYGRLFVRQGPLQRMSRTARLAYLEHIQESAPVGLDSKRTIRVYEGMGEFFAPLEASREAIRDVMIESVRSPSWMRNSYARSYVALHVRLGDFSRQTTTFSTNTATPLRWYVAAVRAISQLVIDATFELCSDGSDEELRPLLCLPNVNRRRGNNPIEDMGVLMNSDLILGSGSTFSAWGCFLGNTVMVVEKGRNHYLTSTAHVYEAREDELSKLFEGLL